MIQLTQIGDTSISVDLENDLVENSNILLFNEIERASFQRVVQDITFIVRNQTGQYSTIFAHKPIATRWRVKIIDDVGIAFVGQVKDETIEFNPKDETCTFTVWSLLKYFWDRAKDSNINAAPSESLTEPTTLFTTVGYILNRELVHASRLAFGTSRVHPYSDLFTKINVHANFASRPIRGWADCMAAGRPEVGNNGRYMELAGRPYSHIRTFGAQHLDVPVPATSASVQDHTTHYDLLTAMSYYYNAEFYIDYTTDAFTMVPRNVIINATPSNGGPHDISTKTKEDSITVSINDGDKFDYIRYVRVLPRPDPVQFVNFIDLKDTAGFTTNQAYIVTESTLMPDGSVLESSPSVQTEVNVKNWISQHVFFKTKSVQIKLRINHVSGTTVYRKNLYRTNIDPSGNIVGFYRIQIFFNVTDTIFYTNTTPGNILPPSDKLVARPGSYAAWLGYEQRNNTWYAPIYDVLDGKNQPSGKILNVVPTLRFVSTAHGDNPELVPESLADVAAFFGSEQTNADFDTIVKSQFIAEMTSRSKLVCTVEGHTYRIGDAVYPPLNYAPELNNNRMFIKRAVIDENPRVDLSQLDLVQEITP